MNKAYTSDEVTQEFLAALRQLAFYWARQDISKKEVADGMAFSMLNMIDGMSGSFGASFDLTIAVHPDDKQYCIDEGDDYYENGMVINESLMLHENYYNKDKS